MKKGVLLVKLVLASVLAVAGFVTMSNVHESSKPSDAGRQPNRLAGEKSPYLLQHAYNPVDWYPWGDEAFEKAKKEDKPIFLSVGYSSCHWCHVMERECFENDEIARLLNEHFVSIKVDREERPDVDDVYMLATQLMTGQGGWPMSVFLTPEGKPFLAGTYFPAKQFRSLLTQVAHAYADRRGDVDKVADEISKRLRQVADEEFKPGPVPSCHVVDDAVSALKRRFDAEHGGFSRQPKFPPYNDLRLLMDEYRRTKDESLLRMVTRTLDEMALGGIYDHIGGGFHRYSTDDRWLVPHFEKMLYDNALLARVYADAWTLTKNPLYRERAVQTLDWMLRDLRDKNGGFYCAFDADSEGEEGKYYVWKREEVLEALGNDDGELFCRVYNIEAGGNYAEEVSGASTGASIAHLSKEIPELAKRMAIPDLPARMAKARRKLLAHRRQRVAPGLDDKILTGWNGLTIGSLAFCGRALGEPKYTNAAGAAADFLLKHLHKNELLRRYRDGEAAVPAYLDDYAFLCGGLFDLHDATHHEKWFTAGRRLADAMFDQFHDPNNGGLYTTSERHESLPARMKDAYDSAIPSSNGAAAEVLFRLYKVTSDTAYKEKAEDIFKVLGGAIERSPSGSATLVRVIAAYHAEDRQRQIVSPGDKTPSTPEKDPVKASLAASSMSPDGRWSLHIAIEIQPGWHINSHEPIQDYLVPTSISIGGPGITAGEPVYPAGKLLKLAFSPDRLSIYEGKVEIRVLLSRSKSISAGDIPITARLTCQPCSDKSCLQPLEIELATVLRSQR